ncbi:MAG TPA: hypothetical protein VGC11_06655 [Acidimicrobiia bacterium]|jgi:hypothetical protein
MKPRRATLTLLTSAGLMVITVAPASAATPAFGFDIRVDGPSVRVVVDFEPVPDGFAWSQLEASGVLDELVGLVPRDQVDDRGCPLAEADPVLLSLERIEEGVYADSVTLPDGRWAVVAWPLVSGFDPDANPGAARTEVVAVRRQSVWVWLGVGAIAAVVVAGGALGLRARRDPVESHPR